MVEWRAFLWIWKVKRMNRIMGFIICILFSVSILILAMCFENFAWRISMAVVSYLFSFLYLENTKTGRH